MARLSLGPEQFESVTFQVADGHPTPAVGGPDHGGKDEFHRRALRPAASESEAPRPRPYPRRAARRRPRSRPHLSRTRPRTAAHHPISTSRIVQRKALSPNSFDSLDELADRSLRFGEHYRQIARPFDWTFAGADLERVLAKLTEREPRLGLAA